MTAKVRTTVTISNDSPAKIIITPRELHSALFRFENFNGDLDAAWIPSLIALLVEAREMAEKLNNIDVPIPRKKS